MKPNKIKFIVGSLFIVFLLYAFYLFDKKPLHTKETKIDFIVSAEAIGKEYILNEKQANEKYVTKTLVVIGKIKEIDFEKGKSIITVKSIGNQNDNVICNMLTEENSHIVKLRKGDTVKIKGVCTGYLLDVMLDQCIVFE